MTPDEKFEILKPLVARLCTSHHWRDHRHVPAPFGMQQLREHVAGTHKMGLCPIAPGESTCRVAVLDFDSHKGETAFAEMLGVARGVASVLEFEHGLPSTLWRSSGGQGIHLYVVWDEPQEAYSVRELMRQALAACGLKSGTAGVAKGEVEIFPKSDEVPAGGCGSMFVLPFAGKSESIQ